MKYVQQDPVYGGWKFLKIEGDPMGKLLRKCRILLSVIMGPDALRLWHHQDVLNSLLHLCSYYLSDTYKLREMWRV